MSIELIDTTATLLREIELPEATRDTLAVTYGLAILSSHPTDWPKVNRAIMERWSRSALEYIKRKAWAQAEGRSA